MATHDTELIELDPLENDHTSDMHREQNDSNIDSTILINNIQESKTLDKRPLYDYTFCFHKLKATSCTNVMLVNREDIGKKNVDCLVQFVTTLETDRIDGSFLEEFNLLRINQLYSVPRDITELTATRSELFWIACRTKCRNILIAAFSNGLNRLIERFYEDGDNNITLSKATWRYGLPETIDTMIDLLKCNKTRIIYDENEMNRVSELQHALIEKNSYSVLKLLEYLASLSIEGIVKDYVNRETIDGKKAVHLILEMESSTVRQLELLIECKADIAALNPSDSNILHLAYQYNRPDFFSYVVEYLNRCDSKDMLRIIATQLDQFNKIPIILTHSLNEIDILMKATDWNQEKPKINHYNYKTRSYEETDLSIIHLATKENNFTFIDYIKNQNFRHNKLNRNGVEKLFDIVAHMDNADMMSYLLENIALLAADSESKMVAISDAITQTAKLGHVDLIKLVLSNELPKYGRYAHTKSVHLICENGHSAALECLLKDTRSREMGFGAGVADSNGDLPLGVAIHFGHIDCVRILLENGANPNRIKIFKNSATKTEDKSMKYNDISILKAAICKHKDILKLLLEYKANPNCSNSDGMNAAMYCAGKNQVEYLQLLIDFEANLIIQDNKKNIALHYATKENHLEAVACICDVLFKCADKSSDLTSNINMKEMKNNKGYTPMGIAVEKDFERIIDYFVQNIPDIEFGLDIMLDCKGYTRVICCLDEMVTVSEEEVIISIENFYPEKKDKNASRKQVEMEKNKSRLLHKIMKCPNERVKYHPVIVAMVNNKVWLSQLWAGIKLFFHLIALSLFAFVLITASYKCGDLLDYSSKSAKIRLICELIVILYTTFIMLGGELVEFVTYLLKTPPYNTYDEKVKIFDYIKALLCVSFYYVVGSFNIIDILAIFSFYSWGILRLFRSELQWGFASIALSIYTLLLLKFARIVPSLYAYVRSIGNTLKEDIPKFSIILVIFIMAYIGGIHLAARQQYKSTFNMYEYPNSSFIPCDESETVIFWLSPEYTSRYNLRYPLLSAIILFLDKGINKNEDFLYQSNLLFTITFLVFGLIIGVIMASILIAQLSETYSKSVKQKDLPFKYEGVLLMEKDSTIPLVAGNAIKYILSLFPDWHSCVTFKKEIRLKRDKWEDIVESAYVEPPNQYELLSMKLSQQETEFDDLVELSKIEIAKKISSLGKKLHNDIYISIGQDIQSMTKELESLNIFLSSQFASN